MKSMMALGKVSYPLSKSVKLALPTTCTIIFCFFLFSCGGDDNGHHPPPPPPAPPLCEYTYTEWTECQPEADGTQTRTVISKQPEGCTGDPVLTQACVYVPPIPEPTDCCPDPAHTLLCGQCTETKPCIVSGIQVSKPGDVRIVCGTQYQGIAQWLLRIDWGIASIKIDRPDLSCCPIEKTGLTYQECNRLTKCNATYMNAPTEWYMFGDADNNWYVYSDRTFYSYRIIVNEITEGRVIQ